MFINKYNYIPSFGIDCGEDSQTVPDQSMTIREMLVRHVQGIPLGHRSGTYLDESEFDDEVQNFVDVTEVEAALKKQKERVKQAKEFEENLKRFHVERSESDAGK